jgi:hypothetical protein
LRAATLDAITRRLPSDVPVSVLLEGLPADGTSELAARDSLRVHVMAPGCPCCVGQLTLRVTLARVLRLEKAAVVVLAIINPAHVDNLVELLESSLFAGHLKVAQIHTID